MSKRMPPAADLITNYERAIVQLNDDHWRTTGTPAAVIAVLRPDVVALAKRIADQLRADHHAWISRPVAQTRP